MKYYSLSVCILFSAVTLALSISNAEPDAMLFQKKLLARYHLRPLMNMRPGITFRLGEDIDLNGRLYSNIYRTIDDTQLEALRMQSIIDKQNGMPSSYLAKPELAQCRLERTASTTDQLKVWDRYLLLGSVAYLSKPRKQNIGGMVQLKNVDSMVDEHLDFEIVKHASSPEILAVHDKVITEARMTAVGAPENSIRLFLSRFDGANTGQKVDLVVYCFPIITQGNDSGSLNTRAITIGEFLNSEVFSGYKRVPKLAEPEYVDIPQFSKLFREL